MKLLFLVAIVAIAIITIDATCPEIDHCDSCSNKGVLCNHCVDHTVLSFDRTACLDCSTGCEECTSDDADVVTCEECMDGYYLKDGACLECADGCEHCMEDDTGVLHCDECYSDGYVQDTASTTGDCIACPSNCVTCKLNEDLSTECTECYSYQGLSIRGYYLKGSDKSCKSCPSNCEKCAEKDIDGTATALCSSCIDTETNFYLALVDEDDSNKDKTKCVKCPTECLACTGVEFSSGIATCTACEDGEGNYPSDGECISCDDNCLTCNDEGDCELCDVNYRLESGSCTECPAFCDHCTEDESTGDIICDTCEEGYGSKEVTSITCDVCTTPNCASCTRNDDGTMDCDTCKDGYGPGSDGKCISCATGCLTCSYSTDHMMCVTCKDGYATTPYPTNANTDDADPSLCIACTSNCATCESDGSGGADCLTCTSDAYYVDEGESPEICELLPANCDEASSDSCDTCTDGFYDNSGTCETCLSGANCLTCSGLTYCDSCADGYGMIDTDLDNSTDACESCGMSNCKRCFAEGGFTGYPKKCYECDVGYAIYDPDTNSAILGTACKKCPTGCDTCTVDYSDNDKTTCTGGGCQAWDEKKAYTDGETGACAVCSSNCEQCTYDSSKESTTCDDGDCTDGYTNNADGDCEACPDNCDSCAFDDTLEAIACDDDECDIGYGKIADGTCGECPSHCDVCSMGETTDDFTLHCDTCATGYVENEDVCADCPSNCIHCDDSEGSMTCSECDDHYALDSDKACVKCASNCDECTATKCTKCMTGYGLAADSLECVDCGEAAFDNCIACGNIDASSGKADCDLCDSGYVLEDGAHNISCADASALSCGDGSYEDKPAECDICEAEFELTEDYHCAKMCYECGDVENNLYVPNAECVIPSAGSNSTGDMAPLIPCQSGICYGAFKDDKVMGGCMPSSYTACSDQANSGETCQSTADDERCERCCSDSECNSWLPLLDGIPDDSGSAGVCANIFLLFAMLALIL